MRLIIAAAVTLLCAPGFAQKPDHLAPTTSAAAALAGPLHTITIITPELAAMRKMYVDGLGLTHTGPISVPAATKAAQTNLWGMGDTGYQLHLLQRPSAPGTTQIRLLVTDKPTPAIRTGWNRQELGPYGMGFPTVDAPRWDETLIGMGYTRATPHIEEFKLKLADGTPYSVFEGTFNGPENLRVIAISRGGGMAQVGVYDPATGRGGPAYATQVVPDMNATLRFFTDVLDWEVRSDRTWREYAVPFRFATVHAKGSSTGHVTFVEYEPGQTTTTGVIPAPPNRGMTMWTFPVKNLATIAARAKQSGRPILAGPTRLDTPELGAHTAMTVKMPNGFVVELFEAAK
jgi:catechol 2,3-dioxygenase-like lactoylglutathione lyase family enzyme